MPFEPIVEALRSSFTAKKKSLPRWINRNSLEIYFLGVIDKEKKEHLNELGIKTVVIKSGKIRRYFSPLTIIDVLFFLPIGIIKAFFVMWHLMPDVVISKGGYASIPVSIAAVFYRVPFLLHESDAAPGLSSRLLSNFASVITLGFVTARRSMKLNKTRAIVTGTPVRNNIRQIDQAIAKKELGIREDLPVLLVMGGSQGAQEINESLTQILGSLLKDMAVIHIAGKSNYKTTVKEAGEILEKCPDKNRYKLYGEVREKMPLVLSAADVVVSRAGATSLAEIARMRKAAIIIPLGGAAQDHQRKNAKAFELAKAVRVIDPTNLAKSIFERNIRDLIQDKNFRNTLSSNVGLFDYKNAAADIADLTYRLATGYAPKQPRKEERARGGQA